MTGGDTIVAAATPPGRGGVGITRISGPQVASLAVAILGRLPAPRTATLTRFVSADGTAIDTGLALYFPAPHSYTGEAVLELHGHGGALVMEALIERALQLGARRARAGEFTERAYLHDKLDLAQAEAVADLIDAGSAEAARAALRSLQGEFSSAVHALVEGLTELRAHVEAAIDFPAEEIDFLGDAALRQRLLALRSDFAILTARAQQGRLLREGMTVVIAGPPNAGKSTLMNRLAGYDAAIVAATPGTTRDVLRERVQIDGLPLHLIDTAGLRDTRDEIEAEGVRRATAEMGRADRVLFLVDAAADPKAAALASERHRLPAGVPVTLVWNKVDLLGGRSARATDDSANGGSVGDAARDAAASPAGCAASLSLSARTGAGLDELRAHLKACMGFQATEGNALSARARHLAALAQAREHLESAATRLLEQRAGELVAEELKRAQAALGEITGEVSSDELLGRIFSSFCIGK